MIASLLLAAALSAPIAGGEVLDYRLEWLGMEVGTLTLRTEDQGECWLFTMDSVTRGMGARLYPASESLTSLVRKSDFQTLYFRKVSEKKKGTSTEETLFDPGSGEFFYRYFREMRGPCVDSLSFIHFLRLPGAWDRPLPASYDRGKYYVLEIPKPRRETVRLGAWSVRALKATVRLLEEGRRPKKGKMTLWFSDDARRLPLMLEFAIPLGTLRARLICE